MICQKCGQPYKKADKFCFHCGADLESGPHGSGAESYGKADGYHDYETGPVAGTAVKMKMPRLFYLLALGISLALADAAFIFVSVSLTIVVLTFGVGAIFFGLPGIVAAAAGTFLLLFGSVVTLVFIHGMWASIQGGPARMTPGQAVGYLFIPFFNIYWVFQVFRGFAQDYNSMLYRRGLNLEPLPEGIFLAFPIITLTLWIPGLGQLTSIVGLVLLLLIVARVCDGINTLGAMAGDAARPVRDVGLGKKIPLPSEAIYPVTQSPELTRALEAGKTSRSLHHRPALVGITGQYANKIFDLGYSQLTIGRDPRMAHLIYSSNNEEISRKHCSVRFDENSGKFVLEDYSLNGTYLIPDVRLQQGQPVYLNPGDRFFLSEMHELYEVRLG